MLGKLNLNGEGSERETRVGVVLVCTMAATVKETLTIPFIGCYKVAIIVPKFPQNSRRKKHEKQQHNNVGFVR